MEPAVIIQETLRWLKENPDHWIKGRFDDGEGNYCASQVLYNVCWRYDCRPAVMDYRREAMSYIFKAGSELYDRYSLIVINDCLGYDAVINTLELALENAIKDQAAEDSKELVTA